MTKYDFFERQTVKPRIMLCLAFILSGVLLGCSNTAKPAQVQKQVESLPDRHLDSFHVFPIEKPIGDDSWLDYVPTPIVVRRYVFVPTGKIGWQATGITFHATFVFTDSLKHAHNVWERFGHGISVGGEMSKHYGADELETWSPQLVGRWKQTVVLVYPDGRMLASTQDWSSVMHIIESVLR